MHRTLREAMRRLWRGPALASVSIGVFPDTQLERGTVITFRDCYTWWPHFGRPVQYLAPNARLTCCVRANNMTVLFGTKEGYMHFVDAEAGSCFLAGTGESPVERIWVVDGRYICKLENGSLQLWDFAKPLATQKAPAGMQDVEVRDGEAVAILADGSAQALPFMKGAESQWPRRGP